MIAELIDQLIPLVQSLGWIGVFIGVLLESIIIPIPSPLIPMGAGFILISREIPIESAFVQIFIIIALVGSLSATLGAYFGYYIGYLGGEPFIQKYGKYLGLSWDEITSFRDGTLDRWNINLLVTAGRAVPIIPLSLVSVAAGLIKMDIKNFTLYTFLGCLPRYFVLGVLGWIVGAAYEELTVVLESAENALIIIIAILIAIYIAYKVYSKKRKVTLP
jgi:membrane protein DedA with SNARE-associated domain